MKSITSVLYLLIGGFIAFPFQQALAEDIHTVEGETKPVDSRKDRPVKQPRSVQNGLLDTRAPVRLPPLDMNEIQTEDALKDGEDKTLRIGVIQQMPSPVTMSARKSNLGGWTALPDGGHVWRLGIEAPEAMGIRVHLSNLVLPEGCEISTFATTNPAQVRGPYTDQTLDGRDGFWTGSIFAGSVTVECYCPPDIPLDKVDLTIDKIIHIYRDPVVPTKVGTCHNDVTCYPAWTTVGNGVAGIGTVGETGYIWCTGCLLNDQFPATFIDYFMTANHCVANQGQADDTEFYWFYQTSSCNGAAPSLGSVPRTDGGAVYLAGRDSNVGNDFAFLRLRTASPGGVDYAGWSTTPPGATEPLTGIHHPDGSYKRISLGKLDSSDIDYWTIQWFDGVTEPGSSGSPLFNSQQEFIGQLYGGYSTCQNPDYLDYYGRFNTSYPYISTWLISPTLDISPADRLHSAAATAGYTFSVSGGGAWNTTAHNPWITITGGGTGSGSGTVTYDVAANTGAARSGTITTSSDGATEIFTINQWAAATHPLVSAEGDFDGDFETDIATFQPATGLWNLLFSDNRAQWSIPFGSKTMLPVPADYDGDGLADIALFQPTTGDWYFLYSSGGSRIIRFGWSKTVPIPGDYDGDGRTDLALFYPDKSLWYFLYSSGGGYSLPFGSKTDIPVPADYDGDGATDIALYRPSSGTWYILYSGGGGKVKTFGWSTTIPVPGDYDSDGRADLAILNRPTSKWCLLLSGGGGEIVEFGYKTMTPVQADYDGDGATDIAMYHPTSGTWYIRESSTGSHRKVGFGGPDQIPVLFYPMIYSWLGLP